MRKGVNLRIGIAHDREKVERLYRHGLGVSGMFMFDNDEDGPDILQRTVEFVSEAGLDLAHFCLLKPDPGTDLFDRPAREGRLLYTDFPADRAPPGMAHLANDQPPGDAGHRFALEPICRRRLRGSMLFVHHA